MAGRDLADEEGLFEAGVREEATLQVLGRLLGGAKKRKKKTYTKPKKIKHKHKKVKLRILKFYKVRLVWMPAEDAELGMTPIRTCRWTTPARCSACARSAPRRSAAPASSWPPTSTASTGARLVLSQVWLVLEGGAVLAMGRKPCSCCCHNRVISTTLPWPSVRLPRQGLSRLLARGSKPFSCSDLLG